MLRARTNPPNKDSSGRRTRSWRWIAALLVIAGCTSLLPSSASARLRLSKDGRRGRWLLMSGRWTSAAAAFQRAVDRGRPSPAELEGLGYACLKAGLYPQGAALVPSALRKVSEAGLVLG
jgi:hypothetical protein